MNLGPLDGYGSLKPSNLAGGYYAPADIKELSTRMLTQRERDRIHRDMDKATPGSSEWNQLLDKLSELAE